MRGPPARHDDAPEEQLPAVEGIILDAGELRPEDRVVYPNQGVCRITGIEAKEIAGQRLELVRLEREEDGAAVLVPKPKVATIGLRRVASGEQIEGVFHYLAAQYDDPELDWKIRHRDNADRLIAGGVLGVAEVVKGLHALSRIRPLPTKEREQYDNARHLLVHEIAVSLTVSPQLAEDYIDYALMPPLGVVFKLKPPPKPVELPSRPRRRVVRTDDEELGLDDLGLGLDADLPEVSATEGAEEELPADEESPPPPIPPLETSAAVSDDAFDDLALPEDVPGSGPEELDDLAESAGELDAPGADLPGFPGLDVEPEVSEGAEAQEGEEAASPPPAREAAPKRRPPAAKKRAAKPAAKAAPRRKAAKAPARAKSAAAQKVKAPQRAAPKATPKTAPKKSAAKKSPAQKPKAKGAKRK